MNLVRVFYLSLFLSLCGATEYYVRPTEPTDTSCPAQPCLTLSQYISNSDLYFKSNTVFKFLPGLHHANQTLDMRNVENVSLQGEQKGSSHPIVMMEIHCSSYDCAGFYFENIDNLIISSLNFSIYVQALSFLLPSSYDLPVSGFLYTDVNTLQIYHTSVEFKSSDFISYSSGISVFISVHVLFQSLTTTCDSNSTAIVIVLTESVYLDEVTSTFGVYGLVMNESQYINITNSEIMCASSGMILYSNSPIYIFNVTVKTSMKNGIYVSSSQHAIILDSYISSGLYGLYLSNVEHITVSNTIVADSIVNGIHVEKSTNVSFMGIFVMDCCKGKGGKRDDFKNALSEHVVYSEIVLEDTWNSAAASLTNSDDGISVFNSSNITIQNVTLNDVGGDGISVERTRYTTVLNTSISKFSQSGINLGDTHFSVIANVTIMFTQFQHFGLNLWGSGDIQIENVFLIPNHEMGDVELYAAIFLLWSFRIRVSKCVLKNFRVSSTSRIITLPAVFSLAESTSTYIEDCTFARNNITALKLVGSDVIFAGTIRFISNRAYRGGAMVLILSNVMKLKENATVVFIDNHAIITGGAIYMALSNIPSFSEFLTTKTCFLKYDLHARLIFINNSAGQGGDVLYGKTPGKFRPLDKDASVSCQSAFDEISSVVPNTLSKVTSDSVRVCICNNSMPDCQMFSISRDPIFPGQSIVVPAVVVGENEVGTVAGSVFAVFQQVNSTRPHLGTGENAKGVTQRHCNDLQYTIYSRNSEEVLILTTINREESMFVDEKLGPISFTEFPVYVNITLLPCPPGFALNENPTRCDCSQFLQQLPGVSCNIKDQTIHRSELVWVGSVKDENQTVEDVITAKYCPLNYCKREDISVNLNQPDTQCEFNHSGILCGGCQPGLSLMLGGVQCRVCSNKNLALIIPFLLAGVVLVFFLKISNLTTSEGFINSLVFYASIVKANEHIFLPQANTNPLTLLISWLNLDLGVQTCFFNGLSAYTKIWLQFVFPFYIWGITGVIIISARYSTRVARITGNNSVPVLATLFLLSYAKLLGIIITSLSYTVLEYSGGQKVVWSADGNIDYLGAKHAPRFVAAVATLLFLWLPYTVLLFAGQWLYKCKLSLIIRMLIKLKPFLDAHYGPLKDSHRYWFGALLLVRVVILLISALVTKNNFSVFIFSISIATIVLIAVLMAFSHIGIDLQAYHNKTVSFFEFAIFLNLLVLCLAKYHTSASGGSDIAASYTLIGIVFVQFAGVLIFRIYSVVKNKIFRYFPMSECKEEEGVWRYDDPIEMQTTQYRNANNIS